MGDRGLPARLAAAWSRRCWPPASGSSGSRRSGWAPPQGEREPGKSDEIDALAVARAVVKDGVEQFPVAYLDEQAMEIRLLARSSPGSRRRAHPDDEPVALASARPVSRARALAQARRAEPVAGA